jgi:hypothetical protein
MTANGVKHLSTSGVSGYTVEIDSDFGGGCGFDYGFLGTGGWDGLPRVTQPNGPGTLPVIVVNDMVPYHLTETITQTAATNSVQVKMAVSSEVGRGVNPAYVTITRVADFDANNSVNNWLDHSLIRAWAYNQDGVSAMLYPSNYAAASFEQAGVVANPKAGFNFCQIPDAATPYSGDGAVCCRTTPGYKIGNLRIPDILRCRAGAPTLLSRVTPAAAGFSPDDGLVSSGSEPICLQRYC